MSQSAVIFTKHVTARSVYLARALAILGHKPLIILPSEPAYEDLEHKCYHPLIAADSSLRVCFHEEASVENTTCLFVFWSHCYPYSRIEAGSLGQWVSRTESVTLLCHMLHSSAMQRWKAEARELVRHLPVLRRVRLFGLDDLPLSRWDVYSIWGDKYVQPVLFPNVSILYDSEAMELFYSDFDLVSSRAYRLNYLGSRFPESRDRLLSAMKEFTQRNGCMRLAFWGEVPDTTRPSCLWHNYGKDSVHPLSRLEYAASLAASDFTLCPPGYAWWTTRPIESLLRGSIPILDERSLAFHGSWLRHMENCIVVKRGRWTDAVGDAVAMSEAELVRMRTNIFATKNTRLLPRLAAGALAHASGIG